VVDLNARQGPLEAIEQLQRAGNRIPIVGFLSHVQTELAQRAQAAGCKQVMPRSKFTMSLAEILSQARS
jgi:DNA-binding NarL/FixJ family response regulator